MGKLNLEKYLNKEVELTTIEAVSMNFNKEEKKWSRK